MCGQARPDDDKYGVRKRLTTRKGPYKEGVVFIRSGSDYKGRKSGSVSVLFAAPRHEVAPPPPASLRGRRQWFNQPAAAFGLIIYHTAIPLQFHVKSLYFRSSLLLHCSIMYNAYGTQYITLKYHNDTTVIL